MSPSLKASSPFFSKRPPFRKSHSKKSAFLASMPERNGDEPAIVIIRSRNSGALSASSIMGEGVSCAIASRLLSAPSGEGEARAFFAISSIWGPKGVEERSFKLFSAPLGSTKPIP